MLSRQWSVQSALVISKSITAYWLSNKLLQRGHPKSVSRISSLNECTRSIGLLLSTSACWGNLIGCWTKNYLLGFLYINLHIVDLLLSDQAPSSSIADCIILASCFPITSDSVILSTNLCTGTDVLRLLISTKNSYGPSHDPCGIPPLSFNQP